jgi:hypothetical protein
MAKAKPHNEFEYFLKPLSPFIYLSEMPSGSECRQKQTLRTDQHIVLILGSAKAPRKVATPAHFLTAAQRVVSGLECCYA